MGFRVEGRQGKASEIKRRGRIKAFQKAPWNVLVLLYSLLNGFETPQE